MAISGYNNIFDRQYSYEFYAGDETDMKRYLINHLKPFLAHFLFWLIYVAYAITLIYLIIPESFNFRTLLTNHLLAIALFYFLYLIVLPNFNSRGRSILGVLLIVVALVLFIAVGIAVKLGLHQLYPANFSIEKKRSEILSRILIFNEYFIYALGYWFAVRLMRKQVEKRLI